MKALTLGLVLLTATAANGINVAPKPKVRTGTIQGRVLVRKALGPGAPIAGATVRIELPRRNTVEVQTDANGYYEQGGLTPGLYKVIASNGRDERTVWDEVRKNDTTEIEFYLKAK